jgi:adenylyltransferase/sulfurtransferase
MKFHPEGARTEINNGILLRLRNETPVSDGRMAVTLSDEELDRYARHLVLREIGGMGQARLRAARVLMVGAGGLGSPAGLYLAAAGVGTLGLVDDDRVSLSNLQRQILFRTSDVGRPKVEAGAEMLSALNPGVRVIAHSLRITRTNVMDLISGYDIIADGTDNFETRFLLGDACFFAGKPLVSAAVTEFEGQLTTWKAFAARGRLPCHRCLFAAPPPPGAVPNCSQAGVLGAATGVMGTLQALEVIKEITGAGESLAGRLLIYEALATRFRTIALPADPGCALCGPHTTITLPS